MGEATRCGGCPVKEPGHCLGLEVRTAPATPGRLCELAATDPRYALELKRRAGEPGASGPRRR